MNDAKCELCGEPMAEGEDMFKFHGYSGPCPKPPLPRRNRDADEFHVLRILGNGQISAERARHLIAQIRGGATVDLPPFDASPQSPPAEPGVSPAQKAEDECPRCLKKGYVKVRVTESIDCCECCKEGALITLNGGF